MCGVIGCAGPINGKHEKAIHTLLILDTLRGEDSTGLAQVGKFNDQVTVAKAVGGATELFQTREFKGIMSSTSKVLIGHNRYATQGKVNKQNAHPYEFDSLVGAHNGTLRSKYLLLDHMKFDVDSENLYWHIDQKGIKDALGQMEGAWALTWWDKYEDEMRFLRNKERPLYLTTTKEGVLFWASESWMLNVALSRNDVEHGDIWLLPEDQLYAFHVNDKGELEKPRVAPAASTKKVYVGNGWAGNHRHPSNTNNVTVLRPTGVIDSKNTGVTPQEVTETYLPSQDVSLKVLNKGRDKDGSDFYFCKDMLNPERQLRLYIKREDVIDLTGKYIHAHMHQYPFSRHGEPDQYFKVEHGTIRIAKDVTEVEEEKEVSPQGEPFYHNARGKLIKRSEWFNQHGVCAWCTGFVDPEQEFKWTSSDETLCHLCAADPEVKEYVNLR